MPEQSVDRLAIAPIAYDGRMRRVSNAVCSFGVLLAAACGSDSGATADASAPSDASADAIDASNDASSDTSTDATDATADAKPDAGPTQSIALALYVDPSNAAW